MPDIELANDWRARVEALMGRRREVWLLIAVAAVAAAVSLFVWFRPPPPAIAPPAVPTSPAGTSPTIAPVSASPSGPGIFVHVAGLVREPGLYRLAAGSRVADAIEAAGGPRARAFLDGLNLAEPLADGVKVNVLAENETGPMPVASATGSSTAGGLVSLNSADQTMLETVPGVGPVTAAAIIRHREESGGFDTIEQLLDVSGIGPATLESLRPYVTL